MVELDAGIEHGHVRAGRPHGGARGMQLDPFDRLTKATVGSARSSRICAGVSSAEKPLSAWRYR
jgi:hypothetical protein